MNDSPPALLRGKEWRCPRHLLKSSSLLHLWVARVRVALLPPWTISGPAGTRGVPRSRERLDSAGLGDDSAWEGAALGGHRRVPMATSRLGLALWRSGASCRGKMRLGLLQYCRNLLGTVLDSVAEQTSLGDESVEKTYFVSVASSKRALEPQVWTSPSQGTAL